MDSRAKHLDDLRLAIRELDATGETGFEGFVATVLQAIIGQPFRLASSGTQRGRDGNSAFDQGATYFEAKRYQDEVPKKDVTIKLAELAVDDRGQVDLWVLGSTADTSAQHAKDYEELGAQHGIGVLLLDWTGDSPTLALAAQLAGTQAAAFLKANLIKPGGTALADAAITALGSLEAEPGWDAAAKSLQVKLSDANLGLGLVKAANNKWLRSMFADRKKSHIEFGQSLAPLAGEDSYPLQNRPQVKDLASAFSGPSSNDFHAVLGEEGAGKSWLTVQAWLQSHPQCLLVVSTADQFTDDVHNDIEGFLIRKIARQIGAADTEAFRTRWRRRFRGWRENPGPENVRMALFIDGLNQAPNISWRRRLDPLANTLRELGGQLIITTRTGHFAQFRHSLANNPKRVVVPDWSSEELRAVLVDRGVNADALSADVFATLRNPRILSMALELLDAREIEQIEEFSVGRLLFEHMRRSDHGNAVAVPAREFARALRAIAGSFMERLKGEDHDDLKLFDAATDTKLAAIASSRYFVQDAGDPDLYSIRDEGLNLALGLWLVSVLEKEERQGRDPGVKLVEVVSPIVALDQAAEMVASAVHTSCLSETCPTSVRAALIEHFVGLQNLPDNGFDAFAALSRKAPDAFVLAAERIALTAAHVPSGEWVGEALVRWREDPAVAAALKKKIPEWLSLYSLAPERMMFRQAGRDTDEQVQEERTRREGEIQKHLDALTDMERGKMEQLTDATEPQFADLHRLAFQLLAGWPLAEFAPALVNWSFSDALASSIHAPHKEFEHLIRFNRIDWAQTRKALHDSAGWLEADKDRSSVGSWTLVHVLRSTGASDDASRAEDLADWLTRDRERYRGWRRVEDYCASDPCDPNSSKPANIEVTAAKFVEIATSELSTQLGKTIEDHFLTDALPGIARFRPDAGISLLRRLGQDVLTREALARRQGVLTLLPHSAALGENIAREFLVAGQSSESRLRSDEAGRDAWLTAQYSLWIAMPYLTGDEQLDAIAGSKGNLLLLQMMETLRPASPACAQFWLEAASDSNDTDLQTRVLGTLHHARTELLQESYRLVGSFVGSQEHLVHTQALGIISRGTDERELSKFVDSGWTARAISLRKNSFEVWYGSRALLAAASAGLISAREAMDRLRLSHIGFAATELGPDGARLASDLIDGALAHVLAYKGSSDLPEIESSGSTALTRRPPMVSLDERIEEPKSPREALDRFNESPAEYSARQKRAGKAYERFVKDIEAADADLAVEDLTRTGVAAIAAAAPDKAAQWSQRLMDAADKPFSSLYHFAHQLAHALAPIDSKAAEAIFRRLQSARPTINRVVGPAKVPSELLSLWSLAEHPPLRDLAFERLDDAGTDAEIAELVLAAEMTGQGDLLNEYVSARRAAGEPAMICRALMVCGYAGESADRAAILSRYEGTRGFIGTAAGAAKEAYERNVWAQHWYKAMQGAPSEVEFWRCSVLLAKIVDGRFSLWEHPSPSATEVFSRFQPTIEANIERRIGKWKDKRKKTLFAGTVPGNNYLMPTRNVGRCRSASSR